MNILANHESSYIINRKQGHYKFINIEKHLFYKLEFGKGFFIVRRHGAPKKELMVDPWNDPDIEKTYVL